MTYSGCSIGEVSVSDNIYFLDFEPVVDQAILTDQSGARFSFQGPMIGHSDMFRDRMAADEGEWRRPILEVHMIAARLGHK